MATLKQPLPASLRSGFSATFENRGQATPDRRPYLVTIASRKPVSSAQKYVALFPHESEDARITGATRSLYRRLLALNLPPTTGRVEVEVDREVVRDVRTVSVSFAGPKIA